MTILTLSRGEARRRSGAPRPRSPRGRRRHRRPAVPRRPRGHPHSGGQPHDRRHRGGRSRKCSRRSSTPIPSHDVHQDHRNTHRAAHGRVPARRPDLLLPVTVGHHRVPPDAFRRHRRLHRAASSRPSTCSARRSSVRDYLEPDLIASTARYWSRFCAGSHAEPFEVIRDREPAGTGLPASRRWPAHDGAGAPGHRPLRLLRARSPAAARARDRRRRPGRDRRHEITARRRLG